MDNRWRCPDCDTISMPNELLYAQSPFDMGDTLVACPVCKGVVEFIELCDEPECLRPASSGFKTETGYRRTCHKHRDVK